METCLKTTVLKASRKAALDVANSVRQYKPFQIIEEGKDITIKAPLKDNAGTWIKNEETGKIKRFVIMEYKDNNGLPTLKYNPEVITIEIQ